jgi:hypothetical protein
MRRSVLAAVFTLTPMLTWADESISGRWHANLGHNVIISMDVIADGHWSSETVQDKKVVAQMAGTYQQKKEGDSSGTIIFTPVESKTTAEHGQAQVETDKYTLENNGAVLRLNSDNDAMTFKKQPFKQ